jgi:squalene synthase HpnC
MTGQGAGVAGARFPRERAAAQSADAAVAAKAADENFPVALRLLPSRRRRYLMAVYVFARTVDDIGDRAPVADRFGLLAEVEADLRRLYEGLAEPRSGAESTSPATTGARLPAVQGLRDAVADCEIPMQPFIDLIEANRQDQVTTRYQTFADLLGYCRLSANPVGRIVLYVFGSFSPAKAELSDSICTALQLAEHWQDVAEDFGAGRIYLPAADLAEYGCTEADIGAAHASPQLRRLLEFEVRRASSLLDAGAPLIGTLRGSARLAVAGYLAGGRAALAAIAAADYDVLAATPKPGSAKTLAELGLAVVRGR